MIAWSVFWLRQGAVGGWFKEAIYRTERAFVNPTLSRFTRQLINSSKEQACMLQYLGTRTNQKYRSTTISTTRLDNFLCLILSGVEIMYSTVSWGSSSSRGCYKVQHALLCLGVVTVCVLQRYTVHLPPTRYAEEFAFRAKYNTWNIATMKCGFFQNLQFLCASQILFKITHAHCRPRRTQDFIKTHGTRNHISCVCIVVCAVWKRCLCLA